MRRCRSFVKRTLTFVDTLIRNHWVLTWLVWFALLLAMLAVLIWSVLSSSAVPD